MGEDLFWAIRGGGGGSFGVIISYKLKLVPVPETVTVFRVMSYTEGNATDVVLRWQEVAPTTVDDLWMRMLLQPVTSPTNKGKKTVRISILAEYLGNANQLVSILGKEFPELGLKKEDCLEMSWIESVLWWNDGSTPNVTKPEVLLDRNLDQASFGKRKSDYVQTPISREGLESLWKKMIEGKTGLVFNPYGGKMAQISASDAPFPHRAGNLFKIQYSVNWDVAGEEATNEYLNQSRVLYSFMTPFVSKNPRSAFLNYRDLDIGVNNFGKNSFEQGKVYGLMYFNDNFDRLVKVKTAVDPGNFFRNEQSIPPLPSKE
ncbi:putative tetrahydroberberine oxidase [Rosa chinensis]|uniref:Putative tetrahydroberberine oxidase n=1 Tax=Rosa chinensis TaxID=74649 RepID=A0A2P6Q6I8_ROSCH|nr:putative tetrahydroberberine oxidase [Rosa chinensis]